MISFSSGLFKVGGVQVEDHTCFTMFENTWNILVRILCPLTTFKHIYQIRIQSLCSHIYFKYAMTS